ncbi:F-box protein At5g52880 [Andrographis paniculata]|uniref:F-box protein At5g52880 n=1 Tax=Andrographis paniculata TaxID=175694 RepID=UPI0021E90F73|nr:F-box protein At5g52880 [Andrographis paniculata]
MGAPNRRADGNLIDRYESLRLRESLAKSSQYVSACRELSFILKNGYSKFPKNLQSLVFYDAIFAFTLLPAMQMQSAISAANLLLQSAESSLPKQKRAVAVKEHKNAVVASKRKSKATSEEPGSDPLPQDVLVHIFSFLDVQSLVSASSVCWSWNVAACDSHLWKRLYNSFFRNSYNAKHTNRLNFVGDEWRRAYKTAYKESFGKFNSNRGYCRSCFSVLWLSSSDCLIRHCCRIKPMSTQKVFEYIVDGDICWDSESGSDSDVEDMDEIDMSALKLWAYPRIT